MKVAIACGGTGGHLFPGLAVGEALVARGHEVLVFISEKQIDTLAVEGRSEFRFERLQSIGMPSPFSPAIFAFLSKCARSYGQCRGIYRKFAPEVVLGMGGFTSTAPILAGRSTGARTYIHESNAIPGKANKLTARFCDTVLLGFEACRPHFGGRDIRVTGTPVRAALRERVDRPVVLERLGFDPEAATILVMGGSQGAHGINAAVARALPRLQGRSVQFIHLTGLKEDEVMRAAYEAAGIRAHVAAFHHAMQEFYTIANLAVARSGAASLTELAWFGIPSILVPYPHAAEDHQTLNARIFVEAGAAELVQEGDLGGDKLAGHLLDLMDQPSRLAHLQAQTRALSGGDAAEEVARVLEEGGRS